jgi:hypothetical protein
MTDGSAPALSVILPTSNGFATIARTVRALHAQTIRHRLELVIVAPSESITIERGLTEGFAGVRVIAFSNVTSSSNRARIAGIRVARAPVSRSPNPHFRARWAKHFWPPEANGRRGPVVCNANPATAVSWTNILIEYSVANQLNAVGRSSPGPARYRRDLLLGMAETGR